MTETHFSDHHTYHQQQPPQSAAPASNSSSFSHHNSPTAQRLQSLAQATATRFAADALAIIASSSESLADSRELDALRRENETLKARLGEIQAVVDSFAMVRDPAVASDGYTYEPGQLMTFVQNTVAAEKTGTVQQPQQTVLAHDPSQQQHHQLHHPQPQHQPQFHPFQHAALSTTAQMSAMVPMMSVTDSASGRLVLIPQQQLIAYPSSYLGAYISSVGAPALASGGVGHNNNNSPKDSNDDDHGGGKNSGTILRHHFPLPSQRAERHQQNNDYEFHPCLRVYGKCKFPTCKFAKYPFRACLSHLKGKCKFGASCLEMHVDYQS